MALRPGRGWVDAMHVERAAGAVGLDCGTEGLGGWLVIEGECVLAVPASTGSRGFMVHSPVDHRVGGGSIAPTTPADRCPSRLGHLTFHWKRGDQSIYAV